MFSDYAVIIITIIFFGGWLFVWSFHLMALFYGKYKFYRTVNFQSISKESLPGVSIIKPLMGVDNNLHENLDTFFNIDYPLFELLFCIQDKTDPVILIVEHLISKYPNVKARLFIGGKNVGINPKINNMIQGYEQAQYGLFLISDAGLKMEKDMLTDMVLLMTEKVGLVHQLPFVSDRKGFAATLEKVYFGTCQCRMYLAINLLGINCVTGMSCLMRKKVIDEAGGLQAFGNYIAEDYFLAQEFLSKNWIIQLSHFPAIQNSGSYSIPLWQNRMIRWCKLRLKLNPMTWLEPLQECFAIGLGASFAVNYLFNWNSLVFFMIHVLCWFLSDYTLLTTAQNSKLPFTKFEYVVSWIYRESICFYLFLQAAIDPTVQWRHGKYRLKWGGLAEEVSVASNNKVTTNNEQKEDKNSNKIISSSSSGGGKKITSHHHKSKSFSSFICDNQLREPLLLQHELQSSTLSAQKIHEIV